MNIPDSIRKYVLPLLLLAAVLVSVLKPNTRDLPAVASDMETQLQGLESRFNQLAAMPGLLQALGKGDLQNGAVSKKVPDNLYLFFFRNDSLISWTSNQVTPPSAATTFEAGSSLVKLKNGWYLLLIHSAGDGQLVGLSPVKYAYPFENRFLHSLFYPGYQVPDNIEVAEQKLPGSLPVRNLKGDVLFSLYVSGQTKGSTTNILLLISQLLLVLLGLYYLQVAANKLRGRYGFGLGAGFLILAVVALRAVSLWFHFPSELTGLALFDPTLYGSSAATPSLGDLIIDCLLLGWLTGYFIAYFPKASARKLPLPVNLLLIALLFAHTALITWIFKTLVIDSQISFEIYNVLSLGYYSLLGFLCIAILIITHFALSYLIVQHLLRQGIALYILAISAGCYALVFAVAGVGSEFYEAVIFSAVWILLFLVQLVVLLRSGPDLNLRSVILFVVSYGIFATFLIENLYERKERNDRIYFAGKLVSERDYMAEYFFKDIAERISSDVFIRNFYANPLVSTRDISNRINALYMGGYFNKYDLKLDAYDVNGNSVRNYDSLNLADVRTKLAEQGVKGSDLAYLTDTTQNYSYLSLIEIKGDSTAAGYLAVTLTPKVYYSQNVYPELLVGSNVNLFNNTYNYNYAIYQNNKLTGQYGDFPYTYYWNKDYQVKGEEPVFIEEPEWEHTVQQFKNGKRIIVSIGREPLFEPVATFSYLFTFFFIIAGIVLLIVRLQWADEKELREGFSLSFRTRINYSMLAMIIVSFVIIGFITISFFSRQYDNFYGDRLFRKEKAIHASLEYFIQRNALDGQNLRTLSNELNLELARLAEINTVDINIFDKNGELLVSSQPTIYEKGLISKRMNPQAYFYLENTRSARVTEQEHIGELKYLATYSPVLDKKGEAIAYMGIPYFERTKDISNEVSTFLVALMNVYVFLLIVAAILAYFVSTSVTRPLTIISEKLRVLNLNRKNEPIEWNSKDEIGVLIGEYNKMITELEQSAQKLAKGERESAWREMAKQIAHEIKNPLTPMKLSIQYLQRAIDEGNPNIEQLAKKVARTLEEQIENLSSIATAFSTFAKMPKPENEIINLNDLLKGIADLFNREGNAQVDFESGVDSPLVFADKNQLISVFNNLVKNAVQSIPEERNGYVDVKISAEDGWVLVAVKDNGQGIPKENYNNVFVPNFTTKSSGTGLGLAICKQIIDGSGGTIWFESIEGEGTVFYVRLKQMKEMD